MTRRTPFEPVVTVAGQPFFEALRPDVLARVEGYLYQRRYDARQIIYFPDDSCDYLYWVHRGSVRVSKVAPDGRQLALRVVFPGSTLGEEGVLAQGARGAYAEAREASVLIFMRSEDMRRLVREEAEVARLLAEALTRYARAVEAVLADCVFESVQRRVVRAFLRLLNDGPDCDPPAVRTTHQELASLVGSTRETTTNVLHELRESGYIRIANRRVIIEDLEGLQRLAGFAP